MKIYVFNFEPLRIKIDLKGLYDMSRVTVQSGEIVLVHPKSEIFVDAIKFFTFRYWDSNIGLL